MGVVTYLTGHKVNESIANIAAVLEVDGQVEKETVVLVYNILWLIGLQHEPKEKTTS